MTTRLHLAVFWLLGLCHVISGNIEISVSSDIIFEDAGNVTLTVTRTGDVGNDLAIDVSYAGDAEEGTDFNGPSVFTILGEVTGPVNYEFDLQIIDDLIAEQDEMFAVTLTPRDNTIPAVTMDFTLRHSDPVSLFVNNNYVDEVSGIATIEISCDLPDQTDQVMFNADFLPVTAVPGVNFLDDQFTGGLVCARPSQTVTADVTIIKDGIITEDLQILLFLSETEDNINGGVGIGIVIVNTDPIHVSYEGLNEVYTEGDPPASFTPTFDFGITDPFDFDMDIGVFGDGATPGVDFSHNMPASASYTVGSDTSYLLNIVDDAIYEGPENFTILITSTFLMTGGDFKVQIEDNDADSVTCETDVTVDEDMGMAAIECQRQGNSGDLEVTITPSQGAGSAVAGVDFTADPVTITFTDGNNVMVANIPITGNMDQDGSRDFEFTVTTTDADAVILTASGTVTMTDNDFDSLTITSDDYYPEDVGSVTVTVTRGDTTEQIQVEAEIVYPDHYSAPYPATTDDVVNNTATLDFPQGEDTAEFTFEVIDDDMIEPNETVIVRFIPPSPMLVVEKYIVITNDDPYRLKFKHFLAVDENRGTQTLTLKRYLAEEELTVEVSTMDNTTVAGEDYTALDKMAVTFPVGEMTASFVIEVLDDSMLEEDEFLDLNVVGPNVSPLKDQLWIIDNEGLRYFDCRRHGQGCCNESDICHYEAPFCECRGDTLREGEDCCIVTAEIGAGSCDDRCGAHGTCVFDTSPVCICDPGYYGETCTEEVFGLMCSINGMTVFANPQGNFQGLIYPRDLMVNTSCHLGPLPAPTAADDLPDQLRGMYRYYAHTEDCGTITPMEKGNLTSYVRVFIVQYDRNIETGLDQVLTMECVFNNMNITVGHSIFDITQTNESRSSGGQTETFIPFRMKVMVNGEPINAATSSAVVEINKEICLEFNISTAYGSMEMLGITFNDTIITSWRAYNQGCVNETSSILTQRPYYPSSQSRRLLRVCFKAFKFPTSNRLGANFRIRVCLNENDCNIRTCPASSNPTRRRRQAANTEETSLGAVFQVYDPDYQTVTLDQNGDPMIVDKESPDVTPISRPSIMPIMVGLGVGLAVLGLASGFLCYALYRMRRPKPKKSSEFLG